MGKEQAVKYKLSVYCSLNQCCVFRLQSVFLTARKVCRAPKKREKWSVKLPWETSIGREATLPATLQLGDC